MKLNLGFLHVVAILSIAGSTLGDADGGCPITEGSEPKTVNDMFKDGLDECFGKVGGLDLEILKKETEHGLSLDIFIEFCQTKDAIFNCLSTVKTRHSACLNETRQLDQFMLMEDVLKTTFSFACLSRSEHLAFVILKLFNHDQDNATSEHNAVTDCLTIANAPEVEGNNPHTSNGMLRFYHQFKVFEQCFIKRMRGLNVAVYGAEIILNGILRSMKCPHPDDGSVVDCEIVATSSSAEETECPYEFNEGRRSSYETFYVYTAQCWLVNLDQLDNDQLKNFTTIQEYQTFFNTYCQNRHYILNCMFDLSSSSKLCQNESDHEHFTRLVDILKSTLAAGCRQDGARFATVFSGIINSAEQATNLATFGLCVETAGVGAAFKGGLNSNETTSSKTVQEYTALVSLKQCILDSSTDVNSFKTVFTSLMDEILGATKCVHPVDETNVLCETLLKSDPVEL